MRYIEVTGKRRPGAIRGTAGSDCDTLKAMRTLAMKEVVDIDPVGMPLPVEVPEPQNCPIP